MDKSSRLDIPLETQVRAWNDWNAASREKAQGEVSHRQAALIERWLRDLGRTDLDILDAGCGAGWMCARLEPFGHVTGVDLADEVIERARMRLPKSTFLAGNLLDVPLPDAAFDVIVSLEVLSHVVDQPALVARLAALLRPGGFLMLATQNKPILERWSAVGGPIPGQIRQWVDARRLRELLAAHFEIECLTSVLPVGDQGFVRVVNSTKVNRLLGGVFGNVRVERCKERLLLGHTLMVRARRRSN
jgi:2-polyprenyl-3-methyl-5-hydroxy-6-metoxy-1,4-benzoquinol methylase